ncbi:MAG: hypothetical protein UE068_12220, partial [Paludibacteraceae bacterium]|nr:hypothetical protein [Paludibacteraceae bacterium]
MDLIISAEKATEVTIQNDILELDDDIIPIHDDNLQHYQHHWKFSMEENSTKVITVPCQLFSVLEYGECVYKTLNITSTEPISVYMDNRQKMSEDATLALPISACGSYYIIQNSNGGIESNYNVFM